MKKLSTIPSLSLTSLEQRALLACIGSGISNDVKLLGSTPLTTIVTGECFGGGPKDVLQFFNIIAVNKDGSPVYSGHTAKDSEFQFLLVKAADAQSLLTSLMNGQTPGVPYCKANAPLEPIQVPVGFGVGGQDVYDIGNQQVLINTPYAVFTSANPVTQPVTSFAVTVTIPSATVLNFVDNSGNTSTDEEAIIETNNNITHTPSLNGNTILWNQSGTSVTSPTDNLFVYNSFRSSGCLEINTAYQEMQSELEAYLLDQ